MTVNVTDGSLGNAPCVDYYPIYPTIYYGEQAVGWPTGEIYVAWYNQLNPTQDGGMFVGVHMKEDGFGLFNNSADYFLIPNSYNSYAVNTNDAINLNDYYISPIALSKNSDAMYNIATNFLYTTYLYRYTGYSFRFNHVFHDWNNNAAYKGSSPASPIKLYTECSSPLNTKQWGNEIQASPNPFSNAITTSFTLPEDGTVKMTLNDILGRIVWEHAETFTKGAHTVQANNLANAAAGVYMLNTSLNGKLINAKKIVKQ